ncbi:hypothetical protein E2C01_001064 [Portunus trituberculatus]|uniref:Uncharacterized protein n=1 Tax=Portunus trituberculatus TaxID=210409 RepID=A0A5B7CJA7_PORTR|nr:hypothetical protein [Portunus trituberculatus]
MERQGEATVSVVVAGRGRETTEAAAGGGKREKNGEREEDQAEGGVPLSAVRYRVGHFQDRIHFRPTGRWPDVGEPRGTGRTGGRKEVEEARSLSVGERGWGVVRNGGIDGGRGLEGR